MAEDGSNREFSPNEKRIVHFTGFAHAATHYVELIYPTLAVGMVAQMPGVASIEEALSWSFGAYLLFGLGALPAGIAADRWGGRRVILVGLVVAGVSACLAAGTEPGWTLALALCGIGTGASLYHPAGTGLLSRAVASRGRALGINGVYGNVGIALSPLITSLLVESLGWRETFAVTGGVILLATLVFSRVKIVEPGRAERPDPDETATAQPRDSRAIVAFVLLCIAATLGGFAYRGNTVAQPALFAQDISFMGYGFAASTAMLLGTVGQYVGGRIADRMDLRVAYLAYHVASLPALVLIASTTQWPLLVASSIYAFFALGMQPIENSLFAVLTPERWRSTAYGLKFVLTFGVGSSAVWMVRSVAESQGWHAVYGVLTWVVVALIGSVVGLCFATRGRETRNA
ncbi:MAG: MFS transporter [Myxococcota bacterium]|nr:MFS transporter [Myxococcota bacterium]